MAIFILAEQASTPATPSSGDWKLYPKSDGFYMLDDTGTETGPFGTGGGTGGGGAVGGRLSPSSAVPAPITDVLAATSVYLTPYNGDNIPRYDGSTFAFETFVEKSITLNATPHPANTNHDVFYYDDGGTKRIGSVKWRNSGQAITAATNANPCVVTANSHGIQNGDICTVVLIFASTQYIGQYTASSVATNTITFTGINSTSAGAFVAGYVQARGVGAGTSELELLGGYYVNKVDITAYYSASSSSVTARYGLYVGTFRTTGTNAQCEDSLSKRFCWSYFNRKPRSLLTLDTTTSWVYSSTTVRQARATATNQVEFIIGVPESKTTIDVMAAQSCNPSATASVGIGIDNTVKNSGRKGGNSTAAGYVATVLSQYDGFIGGYHYMTWLENGNGVGTTTWYGSGTYDFSENKSGIAGVIDG